MSRKVFVPGEILTASDVNTFLVNEGYQLVQTLYFTSSGTFSKATYPWLRAIRVKCQAGGGGGGGSAATGASEVAMASGGSGGVYSESFITDIAGLASSVTVTRGAGGAGASAGNNLGSNGGVSSFGSLVSANGGLGGYGAGAVGLSGFTNARDGGTGGTGDLVIAGGASPVHGQVRTDFIIPFMSGSSFLGGSRVFEGAAASNGLTGQNFGGGGTGGQNTENEAAKSGGTGGAGIVIVELYA
jgi:hypothetical protein